MFHFLAHKNLLVLRWRFCSPPHSLKAGGSLLIGCPRLLVITIIAADLDIWRPFPYPSPEIELSSESILAFFLDRESLCVCRLSYYLEIILCCKHFVVYLFDLNKEYPHNDHDRWTVPLGFPAPQLLPVIFPGSSLRSVQQRSSTLPSFGRNSNRKACSKVACLVSLQWCPALIFVSFIR